MTKPTPEEKCLCNTFRTMRDLEGLYCVDCGKKANLQHNYNSPDEVDSVQWKLLAIKDGKRLEEEIERLNDIVDGLKGGRQGLAKIIKIRDKRIKVLEDTLKIINLDTLMDETTRRRCGDALRKV
jgi:hypothetical protein